MTNHRYLVLLAALLCSAPAFAQRGTTSAATGAATPSRIIASNRAGTTDWRWMTSGIRAGQALWRNFWQGGHAGAVEHNQFGRKVNANVVGNGAFGREVRGGTSNILTGTNQRIDILTGRPID
jgi:hypothetical protein